MLDLYLNRVEISSVQISYEKPSSGTMELEARYKYNVEYSDDNDGCIAHLAQVIQERCDTPSLSVKIKMNGYFSCTGITSDDDKRLCHVLAYQNLFPYLQSAFSSLTTTIGLPNILIPKDHLRAENVSVTSEPLQEVQNC